MEKHLGRIREDYRLYDVMVPISAVGVLDTVFHYMNEADGHKAELRYQRNVDCRRGNNDSYSELEERIFDGYCQQLNMALSVVDEENYADVYKLVKFARNRYFANRSSVKEQRRIAIARELGRTIEASLPADDSLFFEVFFAQTLNDIAVKGQCVMVKEKK